jgi:hypothetical protein
MDKVFGVFSALGNFGFAYSCAIVLLEVQDTLREPPAAAVSMKKTGRWEEILCCLAVLLILRPGGEACSG